MNIPFSNLQIGVILRAITAFKVFAAKVEAVKADGKITTDEWLDLASGLVFAVGDILGITVPAPELPRGAEALSKTRAIAAEINTVIHDQ